MPSAFAVPFHLAIVGTATSTNMDATTLQTSPDGYGFGGGLLMGIPLGAMSHLELGVLMTHRKSVASLRLLGSPTTVSLDSTVIEIPLLYRYWFAKWISFGFGPYYAKYSKTDIGASSNGRTVTFATSVADSSDYGVSASLGLRFALGTTTGLLLDGRYVHGMNSDKVREALGLVGLSFMFGGMK